MLDSIIFETNVKAVEYTQVTVMSNLSIEMSIITSGTLLLINTKCEKYSDFC
jgi:hypothetical protein